MTDAAATSTAPTGTVPTDTATTRGGPTVRFDRRLLAPLILGAILNPINTSIIAVALIPIGTAFGAPASETAWLVSGLYIATAIGQPLVGRLVDTFGPRPLYLGGTALVGAAGILGMLAPTLGVLVVARVVLGFGTCSGYPAAMYLIRRESDRTGMPSPAGVLTALSVSTQTIAVVGPTLGGLLIGFGGWRATFAINVPLAVACIVLGWFVLPREIPAGESRDRVHLDLLGILLFAGTVVALLLFLLDLRLMMAWLLGVAVILGASFVRRELRTRAPFIDLRVLGGNLPLLITYGRGILAATVSYSFLYGFAQWLEGGRGLSATEAGLVLLPTFGTGIVVATFTGRRPGIRGKLLVGAATQVVGAALLLVLHGDVSFAVLIPVALVFGIPQGLVNLAIQNAVYHQAEPQRMGASAGLLRTFMYLGAVASSAAIGAFFGARADTSGLHELSLFMLGVAALFLLLTVLDRSLARVDQLAAGPAAAGQQP